MAPGGGTVSIDTTERNKREHCRMSRSPREAAGWRRRCLFTRSEDGFVGSRLELGEDFRWPGSPKGLRLLTGSVLGYHEVSSFVLCSLFLFRKVLPSSGCLPLSFLIPWLMFHGGLD